MILMEQNLQKRTGQAAVWLLLIAVVGLTLGLTLVSKSVYNVKQSTELEQSNRAFSAAEAGVEEALYALESTGVVTPVLTPIPLPEAESEYRYDVDTEGGESSLVLPFAIAKDKVVQVDATGMTGNVTVYWVDNSESSQRDSRASLVIALISKEDVGNYVMTKVAFNPSSDPLRNGNNFGISPGTLTDVGGITFLERTKKISIPGSVGKEKIIRIMSLYNSGAPNTVALVAESNFPAEQFHTITAMGEAGGTQRTVRVVRSKPILPSIFNFALLELAGELIK